MSVSNFVKKKAHGSRLVAPKFDKETRQSIAKELSKLGANVNQIAKYCNQHQHDAPNYEGLEHNIKAVRERLDRKSTRLNSSHVSISYAVFCLKKKNIKITNTT